MWGIKRKQAGAAWPGVRPMPTPVPSPAETARVLAYRGAFRQAVDLLTCIEPERLDTAVLRDLVRWRNAAFDPQPGRPDWPPRLPDPFPDAAFPPEIPVSELTAAILGGAIQHHGCLLVRGMIDAEQTEMLADVVRRAFAAAASHEDDRRGVSAWYSPYPLGPDDGMTEGGRKFGADCGAVWAGDSPRALADLIALLKAHGVIQVIEEHLGERAFLSLGKCTMRVVPPNTWAAWHQDGAFLGRDIRTVNVWLTLTDCGEDAPGLELYPRRLEEFAQMGGPGAPAWWTVDDPVVHRMAAAAGVSLVTPQFKAGDALLFDQLFLHRTQARPGMTKARLAIESWFFAGSTFPMAQMPFAL